MPLNRLGMLEKTKARTVPGCAPLSYKNARLTLDDAWIEITPETAPLVRETFRLVAEGKRRSL